MLTNTRTQRHCFRGKELRLNGDHRAEFDFGRCGCSSCRALAALLTPLQTMGKLCFMILSVGVDLVEVQRIQRALEDSRIGKRFRERVFTVKEIDYCEKKGRGRYESYAGRFAAKEAVMKALGRGWGSKVCWLDIEVARARSGKPEIVLHDKTGRLADELGIRSWSLSITHTEQHGLAYVIAQAE
jgi:holo-[acyl-carrier protein] synthase